MKIGIICSNDLSLKKDTKKGTEIITRDFIHCVAKRRKENNLQITVFASGDSRLPVKIESVGNKPSSSDPEIAKNQKHIIFELALISKAFSKQKDFDLYHINIGDGDISLPFAPFVKKPILVTLHHLINANFTRKYFSLFKNNKNIFFVSVSNFQRIILPNINYVANIYHGVDGNVFKFNKEGGDQIVWAGRAIPHKGMDQVIDVAIRFRHKLKLFAIKRREYDTWLDKIISKISGTGFISIEFDRKRESLVEPFGKSKLFLFPVTWDEPFGLVLAESLACGTPIIAYSRGSIPEIIKDGETGFIVNPSEKDIRGDWVIKKTGLDGLCEAVERIYSMPDSEYEKMRKACRDHFEKNFTIEKMASEYEKIYRKLT